VLSCTFGAVLDRPVCASVFGVTASWSDSGWAAPWPGCGGGVDLTDAGGEVFAWASVCCDMGPTLVRPSRRRAGDGVAGCVAESAATPGTVARMGSGARRKHSGRPAGAALAGDDGAGGRRTASEDGGSPTLMVDRRAHAGCTKILGQARE
jgi:hypothetical protein